MRHRSSRRRATSWPTSWSARCAPPCCSRARSSTAPATPATASSSCSAAACRRSGPIATGAPTRSSSSPRVASSASCRSSIGCRAPPPSPRCTTPSSRCSPSTGSTAFLERHPRMAIELLRYFSGRLRRAYEAVADMALLDVKARVAKTVLELAARFGQPGDEGIEVDHGLSQEDLARYVGASRRDGQPCPCRPPGPRRAATASGRRADLPARRPRSLTTCGGGGNDAGEVPGVATGETRCASRSVRWLESRSAVDGDRECSADVEHATVAEPAETLDKRSESTRSRRSRG